MQYRSEIDSLRAIAVTSVIFFHFFPTIFPLGYLGVDVFFIISGYLITKIIVSELDQATFTFRSFYLRRVRRILPATLVVLVTTSVVSIFVLLGPDLVRYAKSVAATLSFVSNVYFWRTGGYFGTNDELKPLLHMWSLSVEEQFYLLFPVTLFLLFRYSSGRWFQIFVLLGLTCCSYALNTYLVFKGGANPAFFLLPTRAWQFGVGAVIVFLPSIKTNSASKSDLLSIVGLALVAMNFLLVLPLLPTATMLTLGVGILLWQSWSDRSVVKRIITLRPIRFVGLISFSLYLWHWPVAVFLKYIVVEDISLPLSAGGLVLTFGLSYLSWKYVEVPFRKSVSIRRVKNVTLASITLLAGFSIAIIIADGFPLRHSKAANALASAVGTNYRCPVASYQRYGGSRACLVGDAISNDYDVAFIGNSHAQMYGPAYIEALNYSNRRGLIVPLNGCLPTIDINISRICLDRARENFRAVLEDKRASTIIIALTWYSDELVDAHGEKFVDTGLVARRKSLVNLIEAFEATGKKVFLLGPIEIPGSDFASHESRRLIFSGTHTPTMRVKRTLFDKRFGETIGYLKGRLGGRLLLPHEILCDTEYCYFGDSEAVLFSDGSHLSSEGAKRMTNLFMRLFTMK